MFLIFFSFHPPCSSHPLFTFLFHLNLYLLLNLLCLSLIFSSSSLHLCLWILLSQHLAVTRDYSSECMRRYSWTPDTMDHSHNTVSSPIHSG